MKKKTYELPSIKVKAMNPVRIICSSVYNRELDSGTWGSGDDPDKGDDDYYHAD